MVNMLEAWSRLRVGAGAKFCGRELRPSIRSALAYSRRPTTIFALLSFTFQFSPV